jgi:ubiquinone/menaquinone biosynthesis C-methylase UbiE
VADDTSLIPPREMLYDGSSSPEEFVLLGENFSQYILIPRAHLLPDAAILDLGCGNGAVARALTRVLSPAGRYEGLDINAASVAWLQEHYRPHANFRFTHADVRNAAYNPGGRFGADNYRLPFSDGTFDVVLLKSVFTHMGPSGVRNYLGETSRVLKPSGRSVITFFLLNEESRRLADAGAGELLMRHAYPGDPLCRLLNPEVPEAAIAHDEQRIRRWFIEAGFSTVEISFGNWCGRRSLLGLQDMVIALKE